MIFRQLFDKESSTYTYLLAHRRGAEALIIDPVLENRTSILVGQSGVGKSSLVNALIHHCGESLSGVGGEKRPGIVHRIDKDTSGLLVIAKTDQAMAHLAQQFFDKTTRREYLALVWGNVAEGFAIGYSKEIG